MNSGVGTVLVEGTAGAKALRQECAWHKDSLEIHTVEAEGARTEDTRSREDRQVA